MWNEVWWGGLGLLFLLLPLAKQAQGWPGARSPFSRPCSLPPSTRSRQPLRTGPVSWHLVWVLQSWAPSPGL